MIQGRVAFSNSSIRQIDFNEFSSHYNSNFMFFSKWNKDTISFALIFWEIHTQSQKSNRKYYFRLITDWDLIQKAQRQRNNKELIWNCWNDLRTHFTFCLWLVSIRGVNEKLKWMQFFSNEFELFLEFIKS